MCEANSGGSNVYASLETLARNAKLSSRQVRRLIHGYRDPRTGERRKGFLERGILTLLAKPGRRRRTATYRINEDALDLIPTQQQLPGILNLAKVGVPRAPVGDQGPIPWPPCPHTADTVSAAPGHGDRFTPDTVSADSKALYSRDLDSKAGGLKGCSPAFSDLDSLKLRNAAKKLCEQTAFPDTHSNVAVVGAAIKAIQRQIGATCDEAAASLEACVRYVQSKNYPDLRIDRFFFEDAKYNSISPLKWSDSRPIQERQEVPPECIVGKCQGCGRPRFTGSSWSDYCADSCRLAHERLRVSLQSSWPEEQPA
jgi:hypothetical protein